MKKQNQEIIAKIKNSHGFTLMEMIVVMFIMVMLIGVFLANYGNGTRASDLNLAGQKMITDIRLAQNNALGSIKYGATTSTVWGIHFAVASNNSYILFGDSDNNMRYTAAAPNEGVAASGAQVFTLPKNVIISALTLGGSSVNSLDVTFLPPDPITRLYNPVGLSTSTTATVQLKQTIGGRITTINLNVLGLFDQQ